MKTVFSQIPAREGAQRLVLRLVKECEAAAVRLGSPGDREALHDFRVSLHRLSCLLRDYRGQLDTVPPVLRKEFKKLASGTNSLRDTEAGISLLNTFADKARHKEQATLLAAARLLKARGSRPGKGFASGIRKKLGALSAKLRACLAAGPGQSPTSEKRRGKGSLVSVNGKVIRRHIRRLRKGLSEIKTLSDRAEIHRARLLTKRLRYILEPEARMNRKAAGFMEKIVRLQCLLGKIHDIQVLDGLLGRFQKKDKDLASARDFIKKKETGFFREAEKRWLRSGGREFLGKMKRCSRR